MGRAGHKTRTIRDVPERIQPALTVLLEAIEYAEQTSGNYWEFAVELDLLIALDLTLNDFRWLVRHGLVEHQREVTLEADDGRAFRPTGDLTFPDRTCFVLTDSGISFVREFYGNAATDQADQALRSSTNGTDDRNGRASKHDESSATNGFSNTESRSPKWDCERRMLSCGGMTVKHFRWTAENQEAILSVFEEEGWPPRIDDPLPPHAEQDSKRRLSDTIKCLNRKQSNSLIHFRGDGTGEGVVWEFVDRHE